MWNPMGMYDGNFATFPSERKQVFLKTMFNDHNFQGNYPKIWFYYCKVSLYLRKNVSLWALKPGFKIATVCNLIIISYK